jgi:curved DNA-binding protein CbpA
MFDNNFNFRDLKHNLYEIYKLDNKCSIDEVKKKYKKLMLKFHPDKSSELEEEIFNHIILGYKILSDPVLKNNYDYFLEFNNKESLEFNELKNDFKTFKTEDKKSFLYKEAQSKYENLNKELDKKHKVNENDFNINVEKRFNEIKRDRDNLNLKPDELLKPLINNFNKDVFEERFKEVKITENRNNQGLNISNSGEIMTYNSNNSGLSLSKYSNLDYNNLYIEDSVIDDKFCSLDNAFKLNPEITVKNVNVKSKMDEYKNMTKELENIHVKRRDV